MKCIPSHSQDVAAGNKEFNGVCMKLIHLLYNKDILGEEPILKWYSEPRDDNEESKNLRNVVCF